MTGSTIFEIILCAFLVIIILSTIHRKMSQNTLKKNLIKQAEENLNSMEGIDRIEKELSKSKIKEIIESLEVKSSENIKLIKLFNDSRNPWGVSMGTFMAIKIGSFIGGLVLGIFMFIIFKKPEFLVFSVVVGGILYWYPSSYYKQIAEERKMEWNKIYEFIWIIKHTSMLYDSKKVCIETRDYIKDHYPQYKEIIQGFDDFATYWNEKEIPEFILKYYNFSIPKEIYTILFNMSNNGISADANLENLRFFALNKQNEITHKTLSWVPGKATLSTLPFLMMSLVVSLLIPMILSAIEMM